MANFRRPIEPNEWQSVEETIGTFYNGRIDTLCDHVRVIYKAANDITDQELKDKIVNECKIIMVYAKRMDRKIQRLHGSKDYEL